MNDWEKVYKTGKQKTLKVCELGKCVVHYYLTSKKPAKLQFISARISQFICQKNFKECQRERQVFLAILSQKQTSSGEDSVDEILVEFVCEEEKKEEEKEEEKETKRKRKRRTRTRRRK